MIFNQIPNSLRVPFSYIEFNNSDASSASSIQVYKILLVGQKLPSGTAIANVPVRLTSEGQARTAFGAGSMLASMAMASLKANDFTETWAIPLVDDAGGVAAKSTVTITGPATGPGTIAYYIGGVVVNVSVLQGDTAASIATALAAAINGNTDLTVTAAVNGTDNFKVDVTSRHKGVAANSMNSRLGFYGETLPAGVGVTLSAFTLGTTNPSVAPAITAMGDEQYRIIANPYLDTANIILWENEMLRRWGPLLQNDGHVITGNVLSSGAAQSLGLDRNSPFMSYPNVYGSPTPAWEISAVAAATAAYYLAIDPARPLQTLELTNVIAPAPVDRLLLSDRNVLLYSGIATTVVNSGGKVAIERMVTSYRTDTQGNIDESYLDIETMANLSFLRFDFRAYFGRKYPRHKLASDAFKPGPGQAVLTPGLAKAEAVALFRNWEELGLVEDGDQFKRDVKFEINSLNPSRLDAYIPPNLINGFRILAGQIAFRA